MSNNTDFVSTLNIATMQINRHAAAIMILFGTVGNIINICVLREHTLHKNPMSIYLCWSSAFALLFIWSGLLTRVLQGYSINWPNQNRPMCKIRLYLLSVSWAMACWSLIGASIDRFLCSHRSAVYRRYSSERVAKRFILIIFIFFVLLFGESLYCYESSVPNVPVACYGANLPCRIFNDWVALLADIILPGILLSIFGTLTIRNNRIRAVQPINNSTGNKVIQQRNNDRNLTRMLFIQVLVLLVFDLPFGVYRPYASLTSDLVKSSYRIAIENLSYSMIILLVYFTHSTSFYLYTLTGSLYRAAFQRLRRRCFNRLTGRINH